MGVFFYDIITQLIVESIRKDFPRGGSRAAATSKMEGFVIIQSAPSWMLQQPQIRFCFPQLITCILILFAFLLILSTYQLHHEQFQQFVQYYQDFLKKRDRYTYLYMYIYIYIKQVKQESRLTPNKDDHKMRSILEALQVQICK